MAIIILTMTESDNQLITGIPEYVVFSTSEPSTIYYTFDGEDPTEDSDMAVGNVYLPTLIPSFTLKAISLINNDASIILEQDYAVLQDDLGVSRRTGREGVSVLPVGRDIIDSLAYDADGYAAQETSIDVTDLDIIASRTNRLGEKIVDGSSSRSFINFIKPEITSITEEYRSSPNNDNVSFNPNASVIVIDGSSVENAESQIVKIINRPHGTMSVVSPFYNEHLQSEPIVTGNFVRSMYNPTTGKIVFYYSESRENRWIKSIQKVESLPRLNLTCRMVPTFVFQWIEDRAMSKIF